MKQTRQLELLLLLGSTVILSGCTLAGGDGVEDVLGSLGWEEPETSSLQIAQNQ